VHQARVIARRLAAAGGTVSRRALRSGGVTGSNQAMNALARMIGAELAGTATDDHPSLGWVVPTKPAPSIWPVHGEARGITTA